jgi:hypothetical protein
MSRTRDELDRAAADAEAWLDSLDPGTTPFEDASDLRRVGEAARSLAESAGEVEAAVVAARRNGRSWGLIALALGISRQAARQRYGEKAA